MSELSQDYGDPQPWERVEAVIREKERLLQIQAAERHPNPNDWEDLLNEARITIWEVLAKRPDAPHAYLHASTAMRLTEVITRGKWYGQPSQRGKPSDPIRRKDRDSFDDPDFAVEATAPDVLDRVLMGYHEGEILEAIRSLPHKHQRYIILRFWGGLSHAEIAPELGVGKGYLSDLWVGSIRPVLAERLAHLQGAL
jgi:DNA-directed RNA polymerase specialized sigma24 family protein